MIQMKFKINILAAAIIVASLPLSGCFYTSEISKTRRVIEDEVDADFDTGVVISMGPGLFRTAGWITQFIDDADAEKASRIAYGIRRIKAGVYPVSYLPDMDELNLPEMKHFRRRGWKVAIKVEDRDEVNWLLYRERRHRVNDLFVISLTEDELVLARIQGNLDELLNFALIEVEKDGFNSFDFDEFIDL